jgi:hypothetical protein
MSRDAASPVSFRARVLRLPRKGMPVTIEADERQRESLAKAHGLLSVESFRADLVVTAWKRDGVAVRGRVEADVTQACIVTLDPVHARVEEMVEALFVPEGSALTAGAGGEMVLDPEGPDAPEVFSGDSIDLGALAEEFFALGIDPYPRKPGVALDLAAQPPEQSPFAVLGKLTRRSDR